MCVLSESRKISKIHRNVNKVNDLTDFDIVMNAIIEIIDKNWKNSQSEKNKLLHLGWSRDNCQDRSNFEDE